MMKIVAKLHGKSWTLFNLDDDDDDDYDDDDDDDDDDDNEDDDDGDHDNGGNIKSLYQFGCFSTYIGEDDVSDGDIYGDGNNFQGSASE